MSSDLSASGRREASINGLLSRFVLTDRKEKRPPRVTSVVFNRYGTEILTSYSSESLYLLDPKQNISHEQSQARLSEHRQEKRTRSNLYETKSTASNTPDSPSAKEQDKKASQFKRLRLRGDWSDTGTFVDPSMSFVDRSCIFLGPDARPSNEEESEALPSQQENPEASNPPPTAPNRNLQNFFMQRMSDILTQLATHSPDDSEPSETATAPNETNPQATLNVTEVNSNTQSTSPATSDPIVQLPPSPPPSSTESSANTTTGHDPNEDENTSVNNREVRFLFSKDRSECIMFSLLAIGILQRSVRRRSSTNTRR